MGDHPQRAAYLSASVGCVRRYASCMTVRRSGGVLSSCWLIGSRKNSGGGV